MVTGCVANAEAKVLAGMDGVELVLGTEHRDRLPELLEDGVKRRIPGFVAADTLTRQRPEGTGTFALPRHRARAFVKIQDGCNFRCAFCIVPSVRGRSRSVPLDEVVRRVREAEAAGFAEVVLTGIHIGTWGWDVGHREGLPRLVTAVLASTSDVRVRLGTLDPQEVSDSLVDVFAAEDRICPHLHLGLQSGSPRVLRRMRRGHTVTGLEPALGALRRRRPGLVVTADVIAGFPGETEADLGATVDAFERLGLESAHVFGFSAREGTEAAEMHARIAEDEIRRRVRILRAESTRRWTEAWLARVGTAISVVCFRQATSPDWIDAHAGQGSRVRVEHALPAPPGGQRGWVEVLRVEGDRPVARWLCPENSSP